MATTNRLPYHVAIVGGGIAGLATAYYIQQYAKQRSLPLTYSLLEQSPTLGGKIATEQVSGYGDTPFTVEAGPDSFLTQKPWALQLAHEIGLDDRLLGTNDHLRKTFVLNNGKPTPLPDGVLLIVPTRFMPFALSPLISPAGKVRMGMDLFIPAKSDGEDETLADFIRRRLGNEALDKIAEPLLSGIYNAEAERQSILATFPRFRDIEKKHGSLIRGMLAARQSRNNASATSPAHSSDRRPVSMFMSLRNGTIELVDAVANELNGSVRLNSSVANLQRLDQSGYRLELRDGTYIDADAVVLATPAFVAAGLVREFSPSASKLLANIRYVSTGTISLAFRRDEFDHPLDGFGIVIPRSERRPINAITWTSIKFDHRAPPGYALIRVFFGGSRNPEVFDRSDSELIAVARAELEQLMGINAEPVFHRIYRWANANPQYDVGHLGRVDVIEAELPEGLYVAGSPYRGIGIPDCVHQGQLAAEKICASLAVNQPSGETS